MSFDDFADAHAASLVRLAYALLGDRAAAEDAVQEALSRVYARWRTLDDPLPYARRAVINATKDSWRKRSRRNEVLLEDGYPGAGHDPIAVVDVRAELVAALRGLPHGQRAVLVLRYLQDLSEADTASTLGITLGTVKSQASRGLQQLRSTMHLSEGRVP